MQPHGGMQGALEVMGDNEGDMGLLKKHDLSLSLSLSLSILS